MEFLTSLFVGKPINILVVSTIFLLGYIILKIRNFGIKHNPRPLLIASITWGVYAAWEWLIIIKTPEANIRADLLVIFPILAIISIWSLYKSLH